MPHRPCLEPRCPEYATYRGRCQRHAKQRDKAINRAGAKIYSRKKWQLTRRKQLANEPLCRACGQIATAVDHIVPLEQGGDPWSSDNLQSLCLHHHSVKTRQEQLA
jgi:5-methylcytosine-specific restriction endonuclease McrA